MKAHAIRQLMRDKGVKVKDIASSLGVSSPAVSQVIHGGPSGKIRNAISAQLNKPVSDLWPEQEQS